MAKRLHVKETSVREIRSKWGDCIPKKWLGELLFIRCNAKGVINWEKSPVYSAEELIEKDNVKIIKP